MELSFILDIDPREIPTAQTKRASMAGGRLHFFPSSKMQEAKGKLAILLRPYTPGSPIEGPVSLKTVWYYHTPDKRRGGTFKTTRPDTDNLIKQLKDSLTDAGFWKDDSQVVIETTIKKWASGAPCIGVMIEEVGDARKLRS